VTIDALLALPALEALELVAGKAGAGQHFSTVAVVTGLDAAMPSGAFALATAQAIEHCALEALVQGLHAQGAAGLGIWSRGAGSISQAARRQADALSFPLVALPASCEVNEVQRIALCGLVEYQGALLRQAEHLHGSKALLEGQYRNAFLEDLLRNNVKAETEIHNRANLFGWDFSEGGQVAIVDINNIKRYYTKNLDLQTNARLEACAQTIFDASIQAMRQVFPQAKHYRQSDTIAFILPAPRQEQELLRAGLHKVFAAVQKKLAGAVPFTIIMGVGEYFGNIKDIHHSYTQARASIDLAYQLERYDCVLFYDSLGIYRLLYTTAGSEESREFYAQYIPPIVEHDKRYKSDLLLTLQAITRCGWNLKSAGDMLFIHYNTVKYRFSRICEVTGLDLRDHEQRLAIEIALKLYMIGNHQWL
jgi:purine catabolism regulator